MKNTLILLIVLIAGYKCTDEVNKLEILSNDNDIIDDGIFYEEDKCDYDKKMAAIDLREAERQVSSVNDELERGLDSASERGYKKALSNALSKLVRVQISVERALNRLQAEYLELNCTCNKTESHSYMRIYLNDMYMAVEVSLKDNQYNFLFIKR